MGRIAGFQEGWGWCLGGGWRTVDGLVILLFAEGDLIYWVLVLVKLIVCLLLSLLPPLAGEVAVA